MRMILALFAVLTGLTSAAALNVRDFGAKGDGKTDDTAALQRVADELERIHPKDAHCATYNFTAGAERPFPAIVFPKGVYVVTGPVVFEGSVMLLGEDGATVLNTAGTDTFYCRRAYRLIAKGLTFVGGRDQLRQWTHNADRAYLHVTDCRFVKAAGTALVSDSFKWYRGTDKDKRNPSCESVDAVRGANGLFTVTPRLETELTPYNNSTLIIVENCRFDDNQTALYAYSDGVSVRECVFSAPENASKPQIRAGSGGQLGVEMYFMGSVINYLKGVQPGTAAILYDGGRTYYENLRVKANGDLTFIRSRSHFNEYGSPSVINLLNVSLETGKAPVVSLEGDTFPNRISARGLATPDAQPKRMMAFDREPTEESIEYGMKHAQTTRCIPAELCFLFAFTGVPKNVDCTLPAPVERYRKAFPEGDWTRPLPLVRASKLFRGLASEPRFASHETFGRECLHHEGDETREIENLLGKARQAGGGVVELPAMWLRTTHPLVLPPNVRVTCKGRAAIQSVDRNMPIFILPDGQEAVLENLLLVGGKNAVRAEGSKGRLRLLSCMLSGQLEASIYAHANEPSSLRIDVSGGQASYVPRLYEGNADCSIDRFWFQEAPDHPAGVDGKSYSSIVNEEGGRLVLREVLGVPCYFLQYGKDEMYATAQYKNRMGDLRWVDNRGTLLSLNTRYGGEWGGLTPIYHFGNAKTWLEGGPCEIGCCYLRAGRSAVVADSATADVTILDVTSGINREPFRAVYTVGDSFRLLPTARYGLNYCYGPYAPIWIKGLDTPGATAKFMAKFSKICDHSARLEVINGDVEKVVFNGREVKKHCQVKVRLGTCDVWLIPPQEGTNELYIEAKKPLLAHVISGEHSLAMTGIGGAFKPVGSRLELEERAVLENCPDPFEKK